MSTASISSSDALAPLGVALERLERRDADDRQVVAGELVGREQLADLELDELEDLLVVDHVGLVERHDDVGDADLAGQEDVLTRLRHRAVGGRDDEDRAVHLRRPRDHVLDVVGVPGAVDVRVVALLGLVLDVRDRDRDAALLLLRRLVDVVEREHRVQRGELVVQDLRDRSRQRRLAVVDVTDGADVDVRLGPLELCLRHCGPPRDSLCTTPDGLWRGRGVRVGLGFRWDSLREPGRPGFRHSPRVFLMISSATFLGTSA